MTSIKLVIRQSTSKNNQQKLSQTDSNTAKSSKNQSDNCNLKELLVSQKQLNDLFKSFLKSSVGLNAPTSLCPVNQDQKKWVRIHNLDSKQRMKYGSQFKELLDIRDKVLEHDFDFNIEIDTKSIQQNDFLKSKIYFQIVDKIRDFMVQTLANILSVCFKGLNENHLEEKQVKNYAASNIMLNLQSIFTKTIEAILKSTVLKQLGFFLQKDGKILGLHQLKVDLIVKLQSIMKCVLTNLDAYYPQAPITGGSLKMKSVVHQVNRTDDQENDLIYSNRIDISKYLIFQKKNDKSFQQAKIKLREDEDYKSFIMEVVNCAIKIVQTEDQDQRERANKQIFNEFNKELFALSQNQQFKSLVQLATKNNNNHFVEKQKQAINNYFQLITQTKNSRIKILKEEIQKNELCQKINKQRQRNLQQLKDYGIGIKIPNYVKQFNKQQIAEKQFRAKHSSVLRILTKWAQNLEKIIFNPEQHIMMRLYPFKDIHNKLTSITDESTKIQIVKNLKKQQIQVNQKLKQIKHRNLELISQIMTKESASLPQYVYRFTQTRQVSSIINTLLTSLMVEYLSVLIHSLLEAGNLGDYNQFVNLLVFRVNDLMRARFKCSQSSFITLLKTMYLLDYSKSMKGKFNLIHIKNKLQEPGNNITINYMFMGKVGCQLQLSIQESKAKEKNYQILSHFIYELKRGKFGVISQCAIMISQLDPILANSFERLYYEEKKQIKVKNTQKEAKQQKPSQLTDTILDCVSCKKLITKQELSLIEKIEGRSKCLKCLLQITRKHAYSKTIQTVVQLKHQLAKNLAQPNIIRIKNYQQLNEVKLAYLQKVQKTPIYLRVNSAGTIQFETVVYAPQELNSFILKLDPKSLQKMAGQERTMQQIEEFDYIKIQQFIKKKEQIKDCFMFKIQSKELVNKYLEKLQFKTKSFYDQLKGFVQLFHCFRKQSSLIKTIKFKAQIIDFNYDNEKWNSFLNILNFYSKSKTQNRETDIKTNLNYKKYRQLGFQKINTIIVNNSIHQTGDQMEENQAHWLQDCRNLEYLTIACNKTLKNINFLQKNTLLSTIYLNDNGLQNIDGLKDIRTIKKLYINNNYLQNVDALLKCVNIETLDLSNNKLQNVKGLKNCIAIENLYLGSNCLEDVEILKKLRKIKILQLDKNQLQSVGGLVNCTSFQMLTLKKNRLQNIDGLVNCTAIQKLILDNNYLKNVDGLKNSKAFNQLSIQKNQLEDIDGLRNCTYIQSLKLSNNLLKNVDGLQNCETIKTLFLHKNKLDNVDGLQNCTYIQLLYLSHNQLKNVEGLKNCKAIQYLYLNNNRLEDIEGLKNLQHIRFLLLHQNKLKNVDALENCTKLQQLSLQKNRLESVEGLKKCTKINKLLLEGNLFHSLHQLDCLGKIRNRVFNLELSNNKLQNLDGLENYKQVVRLCVGNNKLNNADVLKKMPKIRYLHIDKNEELKIYQLPPAIYQLHADFKQLEFFDFKNTIDLKHLYTDKVDRSFYKNLSQIVRLQQQDIAKTTFPINITITQFDQ